MHGSPSILPLRLESLAFTAGGERLIDGITARLEAGPRTVILGHNGAGKSLLLRLCHGLLTPSAGRLVRLNTFSPAPVLAAPRKSARFPFHPAERRPASH